MRLADVQKLLRDNPDLEEEGQIVYEQRWQGSYYSGTARRSYPAYLGAAEIWRMIRLEQDDIRALGRRRLSEQITVDA